MGLKISSKGANTVVYELIIVMITIQHSPHVSSSTTVPVAVYVGASGTL